MIRKALFDNSENENPGSDYKSHHKEKLAFDRYSTTENQITVGQQFHVHLEK